MKEHTPTYTKESLHYKETRESILRPGMKNAVVTSVKLIGARPDNWFTLAYRPGERVLNPAAPFFLRKAKEHVWKELDIYVTESDIIKEDNQCVLDDEICDFPEIIILRTDIGKQSIRFKSWDAAEEKYRELVRKFKLVSNDCY